MCLAGRSHSGLFLVGGRWPWHGSVCELVGDGAAPIMLPDVAVTPVWPGAAPVADHEGMLRLVAALLGTILDEDLARSDVTRRLEGADLRVDTDELTGLYNSSWSTSTT